MPVLPLRLGFMGSPDFAVPTLQALLDAAHEVVCVYAQPPRPAGRGHSLRPCPVHAFADAHGIPVRTPNSLKSVEEQARFIDLDLDAAVVAAYGLILPAERSRRPTARLLQRPCLSTASLAGRGARFNGQFSPVTPRQG